MLQGGRKLTTNSSSAGLRFLVRNRMKPSVNRMHTVSYSRTILILLFIFNGCSVTNDGAAPNVAPIEARSGASGFSQEATDLERLGRLWQVRTQETSVSDYPIGPG